MEAMEEGGGEGGFGGVVALIRELQNAHRHLVRSNRELEEALAVQSDEDFEQALEENKEVIARQVGRIQELILSLPPHARTEFEAWVTTNTTSPSPATPSSTSTTTSTASPTAPATKAEEEDGLFI
eukprot:TRINITY_DN8649_c0_g1_i2.p1 TRINITY_DN8649_c0_g1~~TRINITY_DN8649_c0_g1_i2.p1  ORF type:complete len:126 (+),score=41.25 TRINITY_DN8649_c0_g1_i2:19-396(+)